jgi:hypothetical protein
MVNARTPGPAALRHQAFARVVNGGQQLRSFGHAGALYAAAVLRQSHGGQNTHNKHYRQQFN